MAEKKEQNSHEFPTTFAYDDPVEEDGVDTDRIKVSDASDALEEMEAALEEIAGEHPRIESESAGKSKVNEDLKAVLQVSLAINSLLGLDDMLKVVMSKAIELLSAERGFIMLFDSAGELQVRIAHNIAKESMVDEDFKISKSVANEVASTGKSVYTSDAMSDERYANQKSIMELHLRSILCVPLKIQNKMIGLIYLDNSSQAKLFLKSDLYLFELFAQQAAHAIHNATLYNQLMNLKVFNEKVVNNSPVGVVVIDSNKKLASVNDAALNVLDRNREGINLITSSYEPSKFGELVPKEEEGKWNRMIETALTNDQPFEDPRYFHNTGYSEKVLSIKISPISKIPYDGDGLILVIEDITEKVIMEKYVILSEKLVARGEMAASIGHEMNNYLAIIANNAELLAFNIDKGKYDKIKQSAQHITEAISKMKRFTDGLMNYSKLETEIISYDVKRLVEELLFTIKTQKRFRNIELEIDIESNIPSIEIDVGQVQQVLLNLLINAADTLNEKFDRELADGNVDYVRKIKITARYDHHLSNAVLSISDNGMGIPSEHLSKIFQMHFTTKEDGHGLGLANCKKIIANHNGTIKVNSKAGEGTTFTITLPEKQLETAP